MTIFYCLESSGQFFHSLHLTGGFPFQAKENDGNHKQQNAQQNKYTCSQLHTSVTNRHKGIDGKFILPKTLPSQIERLLLQGNYATVLFQLRQALFKGSVFKQPQSRKRRVTIFILQNQIYFRKSNPSGQL